MANFPALVLGAPNNPPSALPPLPEGFTLDATPEFNAGQKPTNAAPSASAAFDPTTMPGLPDGFTLDSDPSFSNPEGTALGRALKRGALRTKSALPAFAAQKGATVLADAALSEPDLIRHAFLETTRLPNVPEGLDISTPELASTAISKLGYPAQFANTFRQAYDIRARDAAAAVGNEPAVAHRAVGNALAAQSLNDQAAALPGSASAEQFKQVLAAAPDTTLDVLKAYAANPGTALAFLGETAAESLPQMGTAAATTLLTRSPAVGAAVLGGGSAVQEFGSGVNEFFQDQGVSPRTPEEAAALIRDPELMAAASRRGLGRGVIIALAEMAGQGAAVTQLFKGPTKEAVKNVTVQAATGAGGEATARAATGQELSAKEIITEALAEGVAAPVEVAPAVYQSRRNAAPNSSDSGPGLLERASARRKSVSFARELNERMRPGSSRNPFMPLNKHASSEWWNQPTEALPVHETTGVAYENGNIPSLPHGYTLDVDRAGQAGTADVQPASVPPAIPDTTRRVQATGQGLSVQGRVSAGQLRTSDVQPLTASTEVPDATRHAEPMTGYGVAQGFDLPAPTTERLGYEGRLSLRDQINATNNENKRGNLLRQWSADIRADLNERSSHPEFERIERGTSTKWLMGVLDEVEASLRNIKPWSMWIEDRINLLEMNLASDRMFTATNPAEKHAARLDVLAAQRRLFEARMINPAFGSPEQKAEIARELRIVSALERHEKRAARELGRAGH